MVSPDQPDTEHWLQIIHANDADSCMTVRPEVSDANQYPIRMQTCSSAGVYGQWWFESDGGGGFHIYNRGYPGTASQLSFVAADQWTPVMKPTSSDAKQHWLVNVGFLSKDYGRDIWHYPVCREMVQVILKLTAANTREWHLRVMLSMTRLSQYILHLQRMAILAGD